MFERRRIALTALATVAITALVACGDNDGGGAADSGADRPKVGMAHDISTGRGDGSFNDAASAALDRVRAELGAETSDVFATEGETSAGMESRLERLARDGFNPVVAVGFGYADALTRVAAKYPDTRFAIVDSTDATGPNIANLVFAEEQGSFLAGAAAALKSPGKNVGYVGGVEAPLLDKFEAGFEAGVAAVDAAVSVQVAYLSRPPDFSGFNDPDKARTVAEGMYAAGADVVFAAAGGSGAGVYQAAKADGKLAIGIQYSQDDTEPADVTPAIMTSMVKRVDLAVFNFVQQTVGGDFTAGEQLFDLKADGVGYARTAMVGDIAARLDELEQQVIDGEITVPTKP